MTGAVEGRLATHWAAVRLLHAPEMSHGRAYCNGCSSVIAKWPCRTAVLVYTAREIAAALAGTPPTEKDETDADLR